jgi:hypothetical protein
VTPRGVGVGGIESLLSLEPNALEFRAFPFRRLTQHRGELLDRVLRSGFR